MSILYDARWAGMHGIGRFAQEVRARLPVSTLDLPGTEPVSLRGLLDLEVQVRRGRRPGRQLFLSPGYAPPLGWRGPLVFTIHDLIHLEVPGEGSRFKEAYYARVVRPAVARASRVLTVSEYSRQRILEWSGAPPERVTVVANGVDAAFSPQGDRHQPGYPYLLYVGNAKPHKNLPRLLAAFAQLAQPDLRLLLSDHPDPDLRHEALRQGVADRVVFAGRIAEDELPAYYRGAAAVALPSLYEGFGLPALEGMACGVPVVVSRTTSLPEVVGDAGVLIDPHDAESIADGLARALTDTALRQRLRERGPERARLFRWDDVAARVMGVVSAAGS